MQLSCLLSAQHAARIPASGLETVQCCEQPGVENRTTFQDIGSHVDIQDDPALLCESSRRRVNRRLHKTGNFGFKSVANVLICTSIEAAFCSLLISIVDATLMPTLCQLFCSLFKMCLPALLNKTSRHPSALSIVSLLAWTR